MSVIRRIVGLGSGGLVIGALLVAGLPGAANAAPVQPVVRADFACGYDGYSRGHDDQPLYNHCGRGDVVIEVDHFFWQTTYACMPPGVHEIPQGTSQWRIIGAEYDGHSCSIPGSVVGP